MKRANKTQHVSRETFAVAVRDAVADSLEKLRFAPKSSDFLARTETFAQLLRVWGERTNLTSAPSDVGEAAFHIVDSLAPLLVADDATFHAKPLFAAGHRILDLGSGAGFPGLILASVCEARFTLAETRRKRASFLQIAAAEMGLANVSRETSSASGSEGTFDVVLSRGVGAAKSCELAESALNAGGYLVMWIGDQQRVAATSIGLERLSDQPYLVPRSGRLVPFRLASWRKIS